MNRSLGVLHVYISEGCRGCELALAVADKVRCTNPRLGVEVIDISKEPTRLDSQVFAVPAYVHDGRLLFLGNPSPEALEKWLEGLQALKTWSDNLDEETPNAGIHSS